MLKIKKKKKKGTEEFSPGKQGKSKWQKVWYFHIIFRLFLMSRDKRQQNLLEIMWERRKVLDMELNLLFSIFRNAFEWLLNWLVFGEILKLSLQLWCCFIEKLCQKKLSNLFDRVSRCFPFFEVKLLNLTLKQNLKSWRWHFKLKIVNFELLTEAFSSSCGF